MLCVLGKYSTRTQMVLRRFQITLCIHWAPGNIDIDLKINFCVMSRLAVGVPVGDHVVIEIFSNMYHCFHRKDIKNIHLNTLTFWSSTIWSPSGRFNFLSNIRKDFLNVSSIGDLEIVVGQPRLCVDSVLHTPVSRYLNADSSLAPISRYLEKDYHLCATLEFLTLCFRLYLAPISQCL